MLALVGKGFVIKEFSHGTISLAGGYVDGCLPRNLTTQESLWSELKQP